MTPSLKSIIEVSLQKYVRNQELILQVANISATTRKIKVTGLVTLAFQVSFTTCGELDFPDDAILNIWNRLTMSDKYPQKSWITSDYSVDLKPIDLAQKHCTLSLRFQTTGDLKV